jgi:hypothetical protein
MDEEDTIQPETIENFENLLLKYKWVRLMCESTADGIWDWEGRANSLDDLPVGENLKQRIIAWQEAYEKLDEDWHEQRPVDWSKFSVEGLEIAKSVKLSLPDWTVIYFDERKFFEKSKGDDVLQKRPRSYFEYEINIENVG